MNSEFDCQRVAIQAEPVGFAAEATATPLEALCWDIDRLTKEADLHWSRIQEHAMAVTRDYWRLGRVLELARGNFKRGKWGPWLAARGVAAYRASQARALARAFASPEFCAGLSLETAVAAARLKLGRAAASDADRKLRRQLKAIRRALRGALPKLNASAARAAFGELLDSIVSDALALRHGVALPRQTQVTHT